MPEHIPWGVVGKIEDAVLSGLLNANDSLGSGETGAQPEVGEGVLPSPQPAVATDSPLDALLDAVSESDWKRAYDLGAYAEQEWLELKAELARVRDKFFEHVGTDA